MKIPEEKTTKQIIGRKLFYVFIVLVVGSVITLSSCQNKQYNESKKPLNTPVHTATPPKTVSEPEAKPWNLILVNKEHTIPQNYQVNLVQLKGGESVDERIYPALQQMFDDARANDVFPVVVAGYRTEEVQRQLMTDKIESLKAEGCSSSEAKAIAATWVAAPGTSEHQLGIAVDINADEYHSCGDDVYIWLSKNSYKYGFILRYPSDKSDITGISSEPWHYRYVGVEVATEMYQTNQCLEEYLEK